MAGVGDFAGLHMRLAGLHRGDDFRRQQVAQRSAYGQERAGEGLEAGLQRRQRACLGERPGDGEVVIEFDAVSGGNAGAPGEDIPEAGIAAGKGNAIGRPDAVCRRGPAVERGGPANIAGDAGEPFGRQFRADIVETGGGDGTGAGGGGEHRGDAAERGADEDRLGEAAGGHQRLDIRGIGDRMIVERVGVPRRLSAAAEGKADDLAGRAGKAARGEPAGQPLEVALIAGQARQAQDDGRPGGSGRMAAHFRVEGQPVGGIEVEIGSGHPPYLACAAPAASLVRQGGLPGTG